MPHKDPEAARAYHLAYRTKNKAKIRAYKIQNRAKHAIQEKAYQKAHRAEISLQQKAYRAANRAKVAAYEKAYKEAHKSETALKRRAKDAANRPKINAAKRAAYAANPGIVLNYINNRRALKLNAPSCDLTPAQWVEIQAAQDHRCWYCGKRSKGRLTQDHIIPLIKGGSHTLHNVIGACRSCNAKKGTQAPPVPVQPLLLTIAPAKKGK